MKSDVTHDHSVPQGHTERLNPAIEVLVINRVLVMPDSSGGICDLIANEANAIVSRIWLELVDGRSRPGIDRRLHSHGGCGGCKGETGDTSNSEPAVGDIVVLVALPGMRLAPGVFMWGDVVTFGKVGRAGILGCVQVAYCHREPVGRSCMGVARVVVCC